MDKKGKTSQMIHVFSLNKINIKGNKGQKLNCFKNEIRKKSIKFNSDLLWGVTNF